MGVDVLVTYDADFADLLFGDECEKVERIVRCMDCNHSDGAYCNRLGYAVFLVNPSGFCAWGERRHDAQS